MLVCIPTVNDKGLAASLSDHFGSAPYYTLVESQGGEARVVANRHSRHGHGSCRPLDDPSLGRFDAVICLGMGRRALASLQAAGIGVFLTRSYRVEEALAEHREGRTTPLTEVGACHGGRGEQHRHGHGGSF